MSMMIFTGERVYLPEYEVSVMQKRKFPTKKVLFAMGKDFFRQKRYPFLMKRSFLKKNGHVPVRNDLI